jgi:AcrR family transcriptional regulator
MNAREDISAASSEGPEPASESAPVMDAPTASEPITRNAVIDAAARVVARRGDHHMRWSAIAHEAGNDQALLAASWFEDSSVLINECYARTAQAFAEALLRGETAPGTALDKVAAFLVAVLELRRKRGSLLSFRRGRDLPTPLQRRLHEWDQMVRSRLKRLLTKGRRDGSLALRNLDSACELILASLQVPDVAVDGPEQRMWDSELVELLLAALSEPHPPEGVPRRSVTVAKGTCLCGTVQYELDGPFEVMSHCHCSMCRRHHGAAFATFVTVPLSGFRWVAGEDALSTYQSSAYGKRTFCSRCGSMMPVVEPDTGIAFCPAGNLDGELGIQPQSRRFVGSHASRHMTTNTVPEHDEA